MAGITYEELRRQRDLLLQENAELREKQRWIPVSERMPEDCRRVLIAVPYKGHPECPPYVTIGKYYFESNIWIFDFTLQGHPSHWMPLPPCPKEEEL